MNFDYNSQTGVGYIIFSDGIAASSMNNLNVNLDFDDAGVLIGIEILGVQEGGYEQGRSDAANDVANAEIMKMIPANMNVLQALEHLKNKLTDIARG
jgi:uncharacterized protein YuzE